MRRRWLTDTSISPCYLSDGERGAIAGPSCMKKRALLISEGRHEEGGRKRVTASSQSEPDEGHGAVSQDEQKPMSWNCLHMQFTSTVSRFSSFIMSAADDLTCSGIITHTQTSVCMFAQIPCTKVFFSLREVIMSGFGEGAEGVRKDLYLRIFRLIAVSHIVVLSLGGH